MCLYIFLELVFLSTMSNHSIDDIREKNPKIIDSYYIVTKTSNMEKFAQMQTIIDGTGFKAKVKYIENI